MIKKIAPFLLLTLFIVISSVAFIVTPKVQAHFLIREFYNSGHAIIFIIISFSSCYITRSHIKNEKFMFLCIIFSCLIYGGVIEVLQKQFGREASWVDFILDITGTIIGIMMYSYYYTYQRNRRILLLASFILLIASFTKPLFWLYAIQTKSNAFPVIFDGENFFNNVFISTTGSATTSIKKSTKWKRNPTNMMAINFQGSNYPGISLLKSTQNWTQYYYLSIDIFNPGQDSAEIILRIHDQKHDNSYHDRFKHSYTIKPGHSNINLLLDYVRKQPKYRDIDLAKIADVMIFMSNPDKKYTLYIDNIYLH